jgi:hypothetical protein
MTAGTDVFVLTARLRRAQPRNADVLDLCDRAEELAQESAASLSANAAKDTPNNNCYDYGGWRGLIV